MKETIRYWKFTWYKRQAIIQWKLTGKRHWVIPIIGTTKMAVMNNDQIRAYNHMARRKGYKQMDINVLMKTALYGTPKGTTSDRRR